MTKPVIRKGTIEDARSLAPRLRPEDALELTLSHGPDLFATLVESIRFSSECFAAEEGGVVIALGGFGVVEGTEMGVPWLVGSPEVLRHPVTLVAAGRVAVERWEKQCTLMSNLTHEDNHVHHRWLRHLGFSFTNGTFPVGESSAPFKQFYRYSQCANQQQ